MQFSTLKNNFMDPKRKPKKSETLAVDESALAKSAAWAWYEHGSGSDRRSIREIDVWSSKTDPKPSRYKLEALRNVQAADASSSSKNSLLLDSYEIERISKQLNQYIEASHAKHHGGDPPKAAAAEKNKVLLKRKNIPKGFWLRHVPACGSSRNDVVEGKRLERRQKLPEKGCVPVVGDVGCRPRPRPRAIRA